MKDSSTEENGPRREKPRGPFLYIMAGLAALSLLWLACNALFANGCGGDPKGYAPQGERK
jgi:hypothetical protein